MTWLQGRLGLIQKRDRGASAVEYGLLVSLIAAVIAAVVFAFGTEVVALFAAVPVPFH